MLNVVAIMGRLVADPELKITPAGISVCTFRIACDRNFVQQGQQRQQPYSRGGRGGQPELCRLEQEARRAGRGRRR